VKIRSSTNNMTWYQRS